MVWGHVSDGWPAATGAQKDCWLEHLQLRLRLLFASRAVIVLCQHFDMRVKQEIDTRKPVGNGHEIPVDLYVLGSICQGYRE